MSKLAQAVDAVLARVPHGYGMTRFEAMEYVRAALIAVRTPDEGMVEACFAHKTPVGIVDVRTGFTAMIDYLLNEEQK